MVNELAKMIDHSLLHPTLTDDQLKAGCDLALQYNVASVCLKPYVVSKAAEWLQGSDVKVGTVIGFPQGSNTLFIKASEAKKAIEEGAVEIDLVVNIGKVLSEDWNYIENEIQTINTICVSHGAILKVIFENDFLPNDNFKIRLCEICSGNSVAFVKTSTGYGMVKGADGKYGYKGATDHDLMLMRKHCPPEVQIKAAGGVRTLDDLLHVKSLGVTRIGATATKSILDAAYQRFEGKSAATPNSNEPEGY